MQENPSTLHRRQLLQGLVAAGSATALTGLTAETSAEDKVGATKGRIKQSIAYWCFNVAGDKWDIDQMSQVAKKLGCKSIELADPELWPTLKKNGLICAMSPNGMPGAPFVKGWNNPKYHEEVGTNTKKMIDQCADAKFPNVIAFTGYQYRDAEDPKSGMIPREEGITNCIKGLKGIVGYAEKKGVTICIEHLNTRDDTHPMKGHPGYQGDDLDEVATIVRKVGSKNLKLLFDIYHVQVMHGDVIRRIEQTKDIIGHIHTAGNPGRAELDETQEIQYAPIMRKLLDIGYEGYVGQEFIPTKDAMTGLRQAVELCDV